MAVVFFVGFVICALFAILSAVEDKTLSTEVLKFIGCAAISLLACVLCL